MIAASGEQQAGQREQHQCIILPEVPHFAPRGRQPHGKQTETEHHRLEDPCEGVVHQQRSARRPVLRHEAHGCGRKQDAEGGDAHAHTGGKLTARFFPGGHGGTKHHQRGEHDYGFGQELEE